MSSSESEEEMPPRVTKSPTSSGSDDVVQPEAKRPRTVQRAKDNHAPVKDADEETKKNTGKPRSAKPRKPIEPEAEPENPSENEENRSQNTKSKSPVKKTLGRKRKNPRATEPVLPTTSDDAKSTMNASRLSLRPRKSPQKRASSSVTSLPIPVVEGETAALSAGDNEVGQLGLSRETAIRFAAIPELDEKIVRCAAGGMHSLLLSDRGSVFSFGCNDDGSLGRTTQDEEDCFKPGRVTFDDVKISKIAAGNIHSIALTTNGHVFIWGSYRDNNGAFGISPKNTTFISEPMKLDVPDPIVDVACGADHTLMLTAEGTVYTMGCAEHGRLGRIRRSHCCRENRRARQTMLAPIPIRIMFKRKLVHFNAIWAGRYCSFARTADGAIYGCGLNNFHQLGVVDKAQHEDNFVYQPVELRAFDPSIRWTQICGGEQHTLALDSEGTVYAMGRVLYGRLGLGKADPGDPDVTQLTPVPNLEKRVVAIAAGDHCSFALDKDGQLWSWGQGSNMLAQGDRDSADETDVFVPTVCTAKALKDKRVVQVAAGSNHTVCVVSTI